MENGKFSAELLQEAYADLKKWNTFLNRYRSRRRLIWYPGSRARERNGEHVMQVALFADFVNLRFELGFERGELLFRCLIHDAPEAYAKGGDTPAFLDPTGKYKVHKVCTRESKPERERKAFTRIHREWSNLHPSFVDSLRIYNLQDDDLSRFISAIDKFVASLNISQDKGRSNKRLWITRAMEDAYKRPKIAVHWLGEVLWNLFSKEMQERPDLYHQETVQEEPPAAIAAE